jgi:glutamate formiminotransferase
MVQLSDCLLAVPNFSEGRDGETIDAIAGAFSGVRLLDLHSDPDHNRSVLTLAGEPGRLVEALVEGARVGTERINLRQHQGVHPYVGALDVAPLVYLRQAQRGLACAHALVLGERIGEELRLPVFLYGVVAGGRTRAQLRHGGPAELSQRLESGELVPDFGPRRIHQTAGAVLVAARPPLVAFNLVLAPPATLAQAKEIAQRIRSGGEDGLTSVQALGLQLPDSGDIQVSTNIEDYSATSPAQVVAAVRQYAEIAYAELVGMAPSGAFADFPATIPMPDLDPRQLFEHALSEEQS